MHIYNSAYPASSKAWLFPPDFSVDDYRKMQARLGLQRTIIVQPVTYGFDNSCTLDSVALVRRQRPRGRDSADQHYATTSSISSGNAARGVCVTTRCEAASPNGRMCRSWPSAFAAPAGIFKFSSTASEFPDHEELIARLPCTVVIDHMGRYARPLPLSHPAVQSLLRIAARDNVYVKLSGAYHIAHGSGPDYKEVVPLARALVGAGDGPSVVGIGLAASDRDGGDDAGRRRSPGSSFGLGTRSAARAAILSDNPARLYQFGP